MSTYEQGNADALQRVRQVSIYAGTPVVAHVALADWQIKTPWFELPPPIAWRADPTTCSHAVLDECAGAAWGYEDCVTCGQRFPMRTEDDA